MNAPRFKTRIAERAKRMKAAQSRGQRFWLGLSLIGALGWVFVIPIIAGLFVGRWLDRFFDAQLTFTLAGMLIGLIAGGYSVWRFFLREVL